jgi:hypothetical protein
METLRYTTTQQDGTAVLSLSGELVFETAVVQHVLHGVLLR